MGASGGGTPNPRSAGRDGRGHIGAAMELDADTRTGWQFRPPQGPSPSSEHVGLPALDPVACLAVSLMSDKEKMSFFNRNRLSSSNTDPSTASAFVSAGNPMHLGCPKHNADTHVGSGCTERVPIPSRGRAVKFLCSPLIVALYPPPLALSVCLVSRHAYSSLYTYHSSPRHHPE